ITLNRFETCLLSALTRSCPRRFAFYVAHPGRSIHALVGEHLPFPLNCSTLNSQLSTSLRRLPAVNARVTLWCACVRIHEIITPHTNILRNEEQTLTSRVWSERNRA